MDLMDNINYYYNDLADPRIKDWFLMDNIWYPIAILLIYFIAVFKLAPAYMKNRPAYKLNTFIKCFDLFQVFANAYVTINLSSCYSFLRFFECRPIVYTTDACGFLTVKCAYIGVWLKLLDLSETVVYVLRKKNNQVSVLHVYHHVTTFLMMMIGVKYVCSEVTLLAPMLNCFIHTIMYSYYFLSTFEGSIKQMTTRFKRYLTLIQMTQFFIVIGQLVLHLVQTDSKLLKLYCWIMLLNYCLNLWLFSHFYKNTYIYPKKKRI